MNFIYSLFISNCYYCLISLSITDGNFFKYNLIQIYSLKIMQLQSLNHNTYTVDIVVIKNLIESMI